MIRAWVLAAACLACSHAPHRSNSPNGVTTRAPGAAARAALDLFDGSVDLDSVRLHLRCMGVGAPLVVFEAGLGLDGSAWQLVQPDVARVTRACAYDRAGRGRSGPAPYPHGQRQMAAELHALLSRAGQKGPYVLVGHSMGAAIARWFLDAHPNDVVGMVLLDPATEDWPTRVLPRIPSQELPDFWKNVRAMEGLDAETYVAGYAGLRDSKATLGSRPLVIMTADKPPEGFADRLEMHRPLGRLSTDAVHVVLKNSSHAIPMDAPARVVAAIREVVRAVRTGSALDDAHVLRE